MADEKGYEVAIKAIRTVLRFLGVWPNHHNWLSRIGFVLPVFLMIYMSNIPQALQIMKVWGNLNKVLEILLTVIIPCSVALTKLLGFWYHNEVIGFLLLSMQDDWKSLKTPTESRIMWKNAKLGRLMTYALYTLACTNLILYTTMMIYLSSTKSTQEFSITLNNSIKLRPLFIKSHFSYNVQISPVYEIVWVCQFLATGYSILAFIAIDSLFSVLILHLCGQLINLQERLKNITENLKIRKKQKFSDQLSTIILRHGQLNRFAQAIEKSFNATFLVQILLYAILFCLQGYQIVIIFTNGDTIEFIEVIFMINFSIVFLFSLFVYCYMAEILRTESTEIGSAAYQSNWYDLPVCEARLFILTMCRSKTPFEITAGKFAPFSLEFYCSILKTSGSYLSVLLAIKDKL